MLYEFLVIYWEFSFILFFSSDWTTQSRGFPRASAILFSCFCCSISAINCIFSLLLAVGWALLSLFFPPEVWFLLFDLISSPLERVYQFLKHSVIFYLPYCLSHYLISLAQRLPSGIPMPPLCTRFSAVSVCLLVGFSLFGPMGSSLLFDWHISMMAPSLFSSLIMCLVVISFHSSNYFLNVSLEDFPVSPLAFSQGCKVIFPKSILNFKHSRRTRTHLL